jgi:hypothetical protein
MIGTFRFNDRVLVVQAIGYDPQVVEVKERLRNIPYTSRSGALRVTMPDSSR